MLRFNHLVTCCSRNNYKPLDDTRKWYKFIFSSILFFNNLFLCVLNELVPIPCIVRRFIVIARGTCNEMETPAPLADLADLADLQ